jgi:KipI family sensor histidine kinase inhibitor
MNVLPYGDAALLVEPDDAADVVALGAAVLAEPGVAEVVPAARTLLVRGTGPGALAALPARLATLVPGHDATPGVVGEQLELAVRYDGPDLADTAAELGLGTDELVARHAAGQYTVAFCGFAPGFAYLRGLDPALHASRLAEPRTRVPAGAVGIAGEFTGIYPRVSPGGWRLLGRTEAPLWDLDRTPPALLVPGTRVRFVVS